MTTRQPELKSRWGNWDMDTTESIPALCQSGPLRRENGELMTQRLHNYTGEPFHYVIHEKSPVITLCGLEKDLFFEASGETYSDGSPLRICGHCRRLAEDYEDAAAPS